MRKYLLLTVMATFLIGCDDNNNSPPPDDGGTPPPAANVDFTDFVVDLVQNQTADNTEPVEINDTDFDFADDDDPTAFDELFNSP